MPARDAQGRFIPNPKFAEEAKALPGMANKLQQICDQVARRARELAPDDPRTGAPDLHTEIETDVKLTSDGWKGRVLDKNFKAAWYEFGTVRQNPRPYLRPALEQVVGMSE